MMTTKRICTTECQFNIAQTNKTSWEVFFFTLLNFTKNFILLRHWCSQTQIKWIFMYFALKLQLFHVVFVPFYVVFLFIFFSFFHIFCLFPLLLFSLSFILKGKKSWEYKAIGTKGGLFIYRMNVTQNGFYLFRVFLSFFHSDQIQKHDSQLNAFFLLSLCYDSIFFLLQISNIFFFHLKIVSSVASFYNPRKKKTCV